jgi:hypothetical protein
VKQLSTLTLSGARRPLLSPPEQPLGQALQSIRQLADAEPLLSWERHLSTVPFDFISYRLVDGTCAAFEKALQLASQAQAVFWDRWSLPRRLAERREVLNDWALEQHLIRNLRACRTVWGIASKLYGEPNSYSAREKEEAERLGKLILVSPNEGRQRRCQRFHSR